MIKKRLSTLTRRTSTIHPKRSPIAGINISQRQDRAYANGRLDEFGLCKVEPMPLGAKEPGTSELHTTLSHGAKLS